MTMQDFRHSERFWASVTKVIAMAPLLRYLRNIKRGHEAWSRAARRM